MNKDSGYTGASPNRFIPMLLGLCLLHGACSSLPKGELSLDVGIKDRGVASWYGKEFHGKLAANGEVFDMTAYTAAHRKLPLGSIVRVLNLENGKSVHVRITDRGPYVIGRMLDLSEAAARALDMIEPGTAAVQTEVIGVHGSFIPVPHPQQPTVSGLPRLGRGPIRGVLNEGGEMPAVAGGTRLHENLYGRRERLMGLLVEDLTAHRTLPVLLVC